MHERFATRIEAGLTSLDRRIKKTRHPLERGPIERQIGRLLQRNSRAAGRYEVETVDDTTLAACVRLEWKIRGHREQFQQQSEGACWGAQYSVIRDGSLLSLRPR